jgi:hypothetical protein
MDRVLAAQPRTYWIGLAGMAVLVAFSWMYLGLKVGLFNSGLLVGAIARDVGAIVSFRSTWPMQERLLDWNKVEVELARQESVESGSARR